MWLEVAYALEVGIVWGKNLVGFGGGWQQKKIYLINFCWYILSVFPLVIAVEVRVLLPYGQQMTYVFGVVGMHVSLDLIFIG